MKKWPSRNPFVRPGKESPGEIEIPASMLIDPGDIPAHGSRPSKSSVQGILKTVCMVGIRFGRRSRCKPSLGVSVLVSKPSLKPSRLFETCD